MVAIRKGNNIFDFVRMVANCNSISNSNSNFMSKCKQNQLLNISHISKWVSFCFYMVRLSAFFGSVRYNNFYPLVRALYRRSNWKLSFRLNSICNGGYQWRGIEKKRSNNVVFGGDVVVVVVFAAIFVDYRS